MHYKKTCTFVLQCAQFGVYLQSPKIDYGDLTTKTTTTRLYKAHEKESFIDDT